MTAKMVCKRCGLLADNLEVIGEHAWHVHVDACVTALQAELEGLHQRVLSLVQERDKFRWLAEQRWAMRKEFEELLGLEARETYDAVLFRQGLDTLKRWKAIAERAAGTGNTYASDMDRMGDT